MTGVVFLVNAADSQSIPWEVGLRLAERDPDLLPVSFYRFTTFPSRPSGDAVHLDMGSPLDFAGLWRLWRLLRSHRPDIVHVHHTASSLWCALLGRLAGARRLVKTEHSDHRFQSFRQRVSNAAILLLADLVICNSRSTQASFSWLDRLVAGHKVRIVYNGIDVRAIDRQADGRAAVRAALAADDDEIVIGTAARLVPHKNLLRLIESYAVAIDRCPRLGRLVILGDGPLRTELLRRVAALGLDRRVLLPGAVSRDEVYRHLRGFDRYVMLSTSEGFCNAAVEAVIAGLPTLVSDIETLHEVLGGHVRYADPGSVEAMAEGLRELVDEPPSAAERARARDDLARRYAIERVCDDYSRIYDELQGRATPRRVAPI